MNYDEWKLRCPPDNTEVEKEKCECCLELFEAKDLHLRQQNAVAYMVCSGCLSALHQDINLIIRK